jgi:hypothetical protein
MHVPAHHIGLALFATDVCVCLRLMFWSTHAKLLLGYSLDQAKGVAAWLT